MNRKILALLILGMSLSFQAAENPVYRFFSENMIFHLSFDKGDCIADMATGKDKPYNIIGTPAFAPGVFGGKSLLTGIPAYHAAGNIDMTTSGTIILWIAPVNWPTAKPENGKEPGFQAFITGGPQYIYNIGKMGGQPWKRGGHLNSYVQYTDRKTPHVNCIRFGDGSIAGGPTWKNGEWRMLVNTWGNGSISNSANGKKSVSASLKKMMTVPTRWMQIGCTPDAKKYSFRLDEVVILNRALTDAEIEKLYRASMEIIAKGSKSSQPTGK